jgi:hypothetical protein
MSLRWQGGVLVALVVPALLIMGCGEAREKDKPGPVAQAKDAKKPHDHSGWWCEEHGIPEAECSMCDPKVAAEFKKKGDWCDKHDRALSQCFICKPERKEFYAAKYRAKYGKEPPPIEEEKENKEEKK